MGKVKETHGNPLDLRVRLQIQMDQGTRACPACPNSHLNVDLSYIHSRRWSLAQENILKPIEGGPCMTFGPHYSQRIGHVFFSPSIEETRQVQDFCARLIWHDLAKYCVWEIKGSKPWPYGGAPWPSCFWSFVTFPFFKALNPVEPMSKLDTRGFKLWFFGNTCCGLPSIGL